MTDSSPTFLLFESGRSVEIEIASHTELAENSPVDACILNGICEGGMRESAKLGVNFAHMAALKYERFPPVMASFFLRGLNGACPAVGSSGGLAFALAWAKKILFSGCPPVAATGTIVSAAGGGQVGKIEGAAAKIEEACRILPPGTGWVFCPFENDSEITGELRRKLKIKGVQLRVVSSVAEAVEILVKAGYLTTESGKGKDKRLFRGGSTDTSISAVKKAGKQPPASTVILFSVIAVALAGWLNHDKGEVEQGLEIKQAGQYQEKGNKQATAIPAESQHYDKTAAKTEDGKTEGKRHSDEMYTRKSEPLPFSTPGITGEGMLAGELARLLNEELGNFPIGTGIGGRVEILEVVEFSSNDTCRSSLSAKLSFLRIKGQTPRRFRNYTVKVEGKGLADELIPFAARKMVDEMGRELAMEGDYPDQGFE